MAKYLNQKRQKNHIKNGSNAIFRYEKTFRDPGSGFDGLLAQLVERMTLNHHVVGSNPTQSTP